MELIVKRLASGLDETIGMLYEVNMETGTHKALAFTMEDEYRTTKVFGETRIPYGRYKLGLRKVGGHHDRYKRKFAAIHKGMLHVLNVPNFQYILIHIGNTDDDTAGCLLVGNGATLRPATIQQSTDSYKRIYPPIAAAIERGEEVWITYWDSDNSRPVDEEN